MELTFLAIALAVVSLAISTAVYWHVSHPGPVVPHVHPAPPDLSGLGRAVAGLDRGLAAVELGLQTHKHAEYAQAGHGHLEHALAEHGHAMPSHSHPVAPPCHHIYRFGGREETAGVHRTIYVCRRCGKAQTIEDE